MIPARPKAGRAVAAALLVLLPARSPAFLGFGDTSFVTVIANPAEAANWAAELQRLTDQLKAASGTLETVEALQAYAGDPRAAALAVRDLAALSSQVVALSAGPKTSSDLAGSWQSLGSPSQSAGVNAFMLGSGIGSSMSVFGQVQPRDASLYTDLAMGAGASAAVHGQIASEQSARALVASELAIAWLAFRAATNESAKQAILSEISQLQTQNQVMDTRRRALLDDMDVADRQAGAEASARGRASDEQLLAESALLNSGASARAQGSEAQRLATLAKAQAAPAAADYSGLRLWTTADTGGDSP
jgi:hypothetical protein